MSAGLQVGHEQLLSITPVFLLTCLETLERQETVFQPAFSVHGSRCALGLKGFETGLYVPHLSQSILAVC